MRLLSLVFALLLLPAQALATQVTSLGGFHRSGQSFLTWVHPTGQNLTYRVYQAPNPIVNSYKTKDGRWVFLNMLQPDRFWSDLCRHIDRLDLVTDPRFENGMARFQHREECVAELAKTFASRTLDEWRTALATVEGVWAPMQTAKEVGHDAQALANGYLAEVARGDGTTFTLVASPVQFDETPPRLVPAPEMAQHTEEVLLAAGYTWEELASLKESGAIA